MNARRSTTSSVGRSWSGRVAAAAGLLLPLCVLEAQSITNTGVPAGTTGWAGPFTISGSGLVGVGWASNAHSYRWTADGGFVDLGLLPGTYATQAESLSADGSVIVGQAYLTGGRFRAFRWTGAAGLIDLGVLPGGTFSYGHGVSGNGLVVVGQGNDSSSVYKAFRWVGGVMTPLPPIASSLASGATAWGTNIDGSIVVGQDAVGGTNAGYRGFRWTSAGGTQTLNPLGAHKSARAFCVSANGAVIAGVSNPAWLDAPMYPVVWNSAGVITNLGLPASMTEAQPSSISADGSVIGLLTRVDGNPRAGMWSAATGTVDLNAYLPTIGIDTTGWVLTRTYGVSADGRTLAGEGSYRDPSGTYIPGSFVLSLGCILPPTILAGPAPAPACLGGSASFTVGVGGIGPFSFSWRKGTQLVDVGANPSAATATLIIAHVQPADVGSYDCLVTNLCGTTPSGPATLSISCPNPADIASTAGAPGCDGSVNNGDFQLFFSVFFVADCTSTCTDPPASPVTPCNPADIAASDASPGADGCVNNGDFQLFFSSFFGGCP